MSKHKLTLEQRQAQLKQQVTTKSPAPTRVAEAQKEVDCLVSQVVRNDRADVINKTYMVDWLASAYP